MIRQVRIRNVTSSPITLRKGSVDALNVTVPALGTVTMPYKDYLNMAVEADLESAGISVEFPNVEVKRVSARDFGAKGNGAANDTFALQSAIDHVASYGGGVVDIPIGVYSIDGLSLSEGITLQGESRDDSVLKMRSGASGAMITFARAGGGISHIRLVGNG